MLSLLLKLALALPIIRALLFKPKSVRRNLLRLSSIVTKTNTMAEFENPLLMDWSDKNYGLPPFEAIKPEHFTPAFKVAMEAHIADVKAIVDNSEPANFGNTVAAFDRVGKSFRQVSAVFYNLCSSNGVPELQTVERAMAAPMAQHKNKIFTFPGLFDKIEAVFKARLSAESKLNEEQVRLVERYRLDFVRAGALFSAEDKLKYAKLTEELAELGTQFTQVHYLKVYTCCFYDRSSHYNWLVCFRIVANCSLVYCVGYRTYWLMKATSP